MELSEAEKRASDWMTRLADATGGVTLPAHLARRIAALLVAPSEVSYLDVLVSQQPGSRGNIDVVALTDDLLITAHCEQVVLNSRAGGLNEAATTVVARPLTDVVQIKICGRDADWASSDGGDPYIGDKSVALILSDTTLELPQSFRASAGLPMVIQSVTKGWRDRNHR